MDNVQDAKIHLELSKTPLTAKWPDQTEKSAENLPIHRNKTAMPSSTDDQ